MAPVLNKHRAPKKLWDKWGLRARETFNATYDAMLANPDLYNHSKAVINKEYWEVTCWNVAVITACEIQHALNDMLVNVKHLVKE